MTFGRWALVAALSHTDDVLQYEQSVNCIYIAIAVHITASKHLKRDDIVHEERRMD
jgi:hypothetical protein